MKDFMSYSEKETQNTQNADNVKDTINDFARQYEGKSENELISAILKEANRRRKNGTLTNADIDKYYSMLYPMLNDSQRKQLDKIVQKLKT